MGREPTTRRFASGSRGGARGRAGGPRRRAAATRAWPRCSSTCRHVYRAESGCATSPRVPEDWRRYVASSDRRVRLAPRSRIYARREPTAPGGRRCHRMTSVCAVCAGDGRAEIDRGRAPRAAQPRRRGRGRPAARRDFGGRRLSGRRATRAREAASAPKNCRAERRAPSRAVPGGASPATGTAAARADTAAVCRRARAAEVTQGGVERPRRPRRRARQPRSRRGPGRARESGGPHGGLMTGLRRFAEEASLRVLSQVLIRDQAGRNYSRGHLRAPCRAPPLPPCCYCAPLARVCASHPRRDCRTPASNAMAARARADARARAPTRPLKSLASSSSLTQPGGWACC